MPRKKITVVDVEDNNDVNPEITDITEPVQEIETIPEEQVIEEAKVDDDTTPIETPSGLEEDKPIEDKKIRSQQLIRCPKCDKMVTAKTLKYSHKKTCPGEEHNKIKKEEPIPEPIPEPVQEAELPLEQTKPKPKPKSKPKPKPKPKPEPKYDEEPVQEPPKQITITPDMIREHRKQMMFERIKTRQDKLSILFANSIK